MTWEMGIEKMNSELGRDSTRAVNIDFKKVRCLDVTVLCSICQKAVHISQLFHHKRAHQAQAVLGYRRPWTEELNLNKLALRQKQLILSMINTPKCTEPEIHKIGFSFEFLKESLKTAPYFCIDSVQRSSVHIREVSSPLIKATAICQDRNALWHANLEDVFVVLDNYGKRPETCFLGLFDGSNGISAAKTTASELPLLFLDQLSHIDSSYQVSEAEQKILDSFRTIFRADYNLREKRFTSKINQTKICLPNVYTLIHEAYAKSFWRMDRLLQLGRNETSRIRWSGCSAITCLVENRMSEAQQEQAHEEEETLLRITNENERCFMKQGELPENISIADEKSITQLQDDPLVSSKKTSIKQQEKDPLESLHEKDEETIEEDGKCFISNDERFQEDQLTNTYFTKSKEGSAGIIHIANIGNVHAVLCKNGESYWLTKEHSTYSTKERRRILQNGGYISPNEPKGLIEGITRTTRGLGYHGNAQLKKAVIPVPHTISIPVDGSCQFLILASNGIWEALDKNEVVSLALIMYAAFLEKYQHAQQRKSSTATRQKLDSKDFDENFFSWYLKPDFLFSEGVLEEGDLEENNSEIRSPTSNGSAEKGRLSSDSLVENPTEVTLEIPPEEEAESCLFNTDSSSLENTESTSSSSGNQTSSEAIQVTDEYQASDNVESIGNQESSSQTEETDEMTFYDHAAKYISKNLVKAALRAGSRDNITVFVTLLDGCDKIPTYVQHAYQGSQC